LELEQLKKQSKPVAQLMGWGSIALGLIVMVLPRRLGKLLGIDTSRRAGVVLTYILAVRDLAVGIAIMRAKDTATLRTGVTLRMLCEISDFNMTVFGWGLIRQPQARRFGLGIPLLIGFEFLVRQNLKD
jgi:hypothetical protein